MLADRIRRVRSEARGGTSAAAVDEEETMQVLVAEVDPVVVLVRCSDGVSAEVAMPSQFIVGGRKTDHATVREAAARSTTVVCRIIEVMRSAGENAMFKLSPFSTGSIIRPLGPTVTPVTPIVAVTETGNRRWSLGEFSLSVMLEMYAVCRWNVKGSEKGQKVSRIYYIHFHRPCV